MKNYQQLPIKNSCNTFLKPETFNISIYIRSIVVCNIILHRE